MEIETKALELTLGDQGQMFAGVATVRQAIFDIIDRGDQDEQPWMFYENEDPRSYFNQEAADADRHNFVSHVITRIAELQAPPHGGVKLENLCPRHRREALPVATAKVCGMCQVERGSDG